MKAHFKSRTGRLVVEVEGANIKHLFGQIAEVQEILDADAQCGACGSDQIKFNVRSVDAFDFYELQCDNCNARLSFGQNKDGKGLFPKRKGEDHNPLPNRGWQQYIAERSKK